MGFIPAPGQKNAVATLSVNGLTGNKGVGGDPLTVLAHASLGQRPLSLCIASLVRPVRGQLTCRDVGKP